MRTINHADDATLLAELHDLFDRHHETGREVHMRDRNHASARRHGVAQLVKDELRIARRCGNVDLLECHVPPRGYQLPAAKSADVLVIGRDNFITITVVETIRDEIHRFGGIAWKS